MSVQFDTISEPWMWRHAVTKFVQGARYGQGCKTVLGIKKLSSFELYSFELPVSSSFMANIGPVFESINITLISFEDQGTALVLRSEDSSANFLLRWTELMRSSQRYDADISNKVSKEENYKLYGLGQVYLFLLAV